MAITVTVFPTANREGEELLEGVRTLFAERFGRGAAVSPGERTPGACLKACWLSDLVVLDATAAPEGEHNYGLFTGIQRNLDHVLVVGRTYLALNVRGFRPGGAPIYPHVQKNDAILRWIASQLDGDDPPLLPRPWHEKLTLGYTALSRATCTVRAERKARWQVFISYRTRDYAAACEAKAQAEAAYGPGTAILYAPQELAGRDEVLTPLQRWNVLSIISDVILGCKEFWVIDGPEYLRSWWVRGELATHAYQSRSRVRLYDPRRKEASDAPGEYVPAMAEEQKQRMARLFANSHPDMMAPESIATMEMIRAAGVGRAGGIARDLVFTDEFWNYPLLQCDRCSFPGESVEPLDHARLLGNEYPVLYPIATEVLRNAAETDQAIPCPGKQCGEEYRIFPTLPRYLWYPLPVGPNRTSLEEFATYRLEG
jgi:hypothetical protein